MTTHTHTHTSRPSSVSPLESFDRLLQRCNTGLLGVELCLPVCFFLLQRRQQRLPLCELLLGFMHLCLDLVLLWSMIDDRNKCAAKACT